MSGCFLFDQTPVGRHGHDPPGQKLAAVADRLRDGALDPAAAGNLHPHDGHALDIILTDDGGQLVGVVTLVQLGTADEGHAVADELLVEVAVGVRRAGVLTADKRRFTLL